MEVKWKDVAHMHLSCQVEYLDYFTDTRRIGRMNMVGEDNFFIDGDNNAQEIAQAKPILRKLSDMTEEEKKELRKIMSNAGSVNMLPEIRTSNVLQLFFNAENPKIMLWLLQRGFDLYNLIESGEAIDKATLK